MGWDGVGGEEVGGTYAEEGTDYGEDDDGEDGDDDAVQDTSVTERSRSPACSVTDDEP